MSYSFREYSSTFFIPEKAPNLEQVYSLDKNPSMQYLLHAIRTDANGGEPFRKNLEFIGMILAEFYAKQYNSTTSHIVQGPYGPVQKPSYTRKPIVFGIPRGAIPIAKGIHSLFQESQLVFTNDGDNKDATQPLLDPALTIDTDVSDILIADTVLGSGSTMIRNINGIKEISEGRQLYVFTAVALHNFQGYGIERVLQEHPDITIITGCLESRAEFKERHDGWHLYVNGLGSVGDLVEQP